MRPSTLRIVFVAGMAALVLFGAASESMACFDCLFPWNWCRREPVATYAAPACAPAYNPCPPRTCYYVPQTSYRTVYQCAATTACCPVSSCDPCTGCAVTTYRPVTRYALRPTLVPYTTYRIVYGPSCAPCASPCGPCGSFSPCGVGGVVSAPLGAGGGCASCVAPAVAPSTVVPSPSTVQPVLPSPGAAQPAVPGSVVAPPPASPQATAPSGLAPVPTFSSPAPSTGSSTLRTQPWTAPNTYAGPSLRPRDGGSPSTLRTDPLIKPIPVPGASPASTSPPQLTPPSNNTPSGRIRQAVYLRASTSPEGVRVGPLTDNEYDWHASRQ